MGTKQYRNDFVAFVDSSEKIDDPLIQMQLTYIEPLEVWEKISSKIPSDVDFIIALTSSS